LVTIIEIAKVFGISTDNFYRPEKSAKAVLAKDVLTLIGREQGAGVN
jgi:hypothetical protein